MMRADGDEAFGTDTGPYIRFPALSLKAPEFETLKIFSELYRSTE